MAPTYCRLMAISVVLTSQSWKVGAEQSPSFPEDHRGVVAGGVLAVQNAEGAIVVMYGAGAWAEARGDVRFRAG